MARAGFQRDEELCQKYAQFASHLDRWQFKVLYWFLFITNLMVLFIASWTYTRGQDALEKYSHDSRRRARSLRKYMLLCLGCVLLSTVLVVMEAYALLALQFCDGEDLMNLYWSTWTMIQIGSLIAMMGIILALAHSLRNRRHPPWALALGTPVLVIAGILHLIHDCTKKRVKRRLSKSVASLDGGPSMSEVNTIQGNPEDDVEIQGEFIGFTIDGGPIVRFNTASPVGFDPNCEVLGYSDGNRPLVAYQKDSIRFISAAQEKPAPSTDNKNEKEKERQIAEEVV
ncbi:hypothetical protein PT974_07543 [Cladobotryum mycophilum]|uniref:Uncharacterized protein n=1 Tax=Cladobotryum mycophilum TaxID=491253 RepID=A0ABR0SPR4_9HYPO